MSLRTASAIGRICIASPDQKLSCAGSTSLHAASPPTHDKTLRDNWMESLKARTEHIWTSVDWKEKTGW